MNDNLKSALRYAALGWRVYPVYGIKGGKCLCAGKVTNCKPGKHPWGLKVPHGGKDATTDTAKLTDWFRGALVNVGVRVEGFCVLDVENRNGGMELLAQWEREHGLMPPTPTARSGSDGRHFYFKAVDQFTAHGKEKIKFSTGAELLIGGDVIATPSNHESGGRYEWLVPPETPLAVMPQWLVALVGSYLASERQRDANQSDEMSEPFDPMNPTVATVETFASLEKIPTHQRNEPVNRAIGCMLRGGFTREQILEQGTRWALQQEPPYSVDDLTAKVNLFAGRVLVEIDERENCEPIDRNEKTAPTFASLQFAGSQAANPTIVTPTPLTPSTGLPDAAYHGWIGEFVHTVQPLTEADPAGVLACVLTGVGNALGRTLHHRIGRRHAGNLFTLLVGHTSSRKGTCWDVAECLLSAAAPDWSAGCVENGFGSGQGFAYRIRDAQGEDAGIPDKRLLVVEEEWAKPLRLCRSETSILSPLIRSAFDGKPLSVMNRGENRYGCREPHVSIIGMITADELREQVKGRTELVNGTLNRFLFVNCERRQYLSAGGDYFSVGSRFSKRFAAALNAVKSDSPLSLDASATEVWDAEYRRLEQPKEGDYGKAVARLSVHCLKVAMLYAVLDGSPVVRFPHLRAALALVDYCDRSARSVFGKENMATVNTETEPDYPEPPHAKLLNLIRNRPEGIIKRDAHALFSNRMRGDELNGLFVLLTDSGFVVEMEGRWYAAERFQRDGCKGVGGIPDGDAVPPVARVANGEHANTDDGQADKGEYAKNSESDFPHSHVRSSQFASPQPDSNPTHPLNQSLPSAPVTVDVGGITGADEHERGLLRP